MSQISTASGLRVRFGEFPDAWDTVLVVLFHQGRLVLGFNGVRSGWEFPGGHREGDEAWQDTARREAWEEVGAVFDEVECLGHYVVPGRHTTLVALATATRLDPLPAGFETTERQEFETLPVNLTFADGLYEQILQKLGRG